MLAFVVDADEVTRLKLELAAAQASRTDRLAGMLRGVAASRPTGWVAQHRGVLQGVAVALGAIVLFSWDPPTAALVLVDAALVLAAVALIAGVARVSRA
jgi:hypothetical protein